jgi:hypothetical protein
VHLAEVHATTLGMPDIPIVSLIHPLGGIDKQEVQAKARLAVDGLIAALTGKSTAVEVHESRPPEAKQVRVPNDLSTVLDFLRQSGWTDGLPVVPPTAELVSEMVAATGRPADEVVAVLPPDDGEATVECIAANAVLAGCAPQVAPLLVASVEAVATREFNLLGVQATTHPCAVLVIVSGPAAAEAGIAGGEGCLGTGFGTNLSLGRALRMILMNIGGAVPGRTDRSCQGSPAKLAYCFTENLVASPWAAFLADQGWSEADSAVTVVAAEGPHNIQDHTSQTAAGILDTVASAMRNVGCNDFAVQLGSTLRAGTRRFRSRPVVVLGPEHAQTIAREGFTRTDVQRHLWEAARILPSEIPHEWVGAARIEDRVPLLGGPEDVILLVAGGIGKHSCWMPTFGDTAPVTRRVTLPAPPTR